MHQAAWNEITPLYDLSHINKGSIAKFKLLFSSQQFHTKGEGSPHHYCAFFLPYHRDSNSIYLCDHKKAGDWIPPGGHIEKGETPSQAAIREIKEELGYDALASQLTPWNLSVKPIGRKKEGCLTHYDVWFLVEMTKPIEFAYDQREYHAARWFKVEEGTTHVKHNPDFAKIISQLLD